MKRFLAVTALLLALAASAGANTFSGISLTGTPSSCYSFSIKKLIQDCIAANQASAPPGNPGPFTRGYKSIVVLAGQCYSGGFQDLTSIGDNVVVAAASAPEKESHNDGPKADRRMRYLQGIIDGIHSNANRPIKDIADASKAASGVSALDMTPNAATSTGGGTVVMGDPQNNMQPAMSYHAVLFAGVAETNTGSSDDLSTRLRNAHMKALDQMETALKDKLHIPAGNIQKKFGGSKTDLENMIKSTWNQMNDNEQFIFVIADHGSRCCVADIIQPLIDRLRAFFRTLPYMISQFVTQPVVEIATDVVMQPASVTFNGSPIGTIPPGTGPAHHEFPISPSMLMPIGSDNTVDIIIAPSEIDLATVALTTGAVASEVDDEPTATLMGNFIADAAIGHVDLEWSAVVDGSVVWEVERADADQGAYLRLASVSGTGAQAVYHFRDASVEPGREYVYRVGFREQGVMTYSSPVRVLTPRALFAIREISPNPTERGARIEFLVPERGHAALGLFDIGGRRVATLHDGVVEAGATTVVWDGRRDDGTAMAAGTYLVRLTAQGRTLSRKLVVVQ